MSSSASSFPRIAPSPFGMRATSCAGPKSISSAPSRQAIAPSTTSASKAWTTPCSQVCVRGWTQSTMAARSRGGSPGPRDNAIDAPRPFLVHHRRRLRAAPRGGRGRARRRRLRLLVLETQHRVARAPPPAPRHGARRGRRRQRVDAPRARPLPGNVGARRGKVGGARFGADKHRQLRARFGVQRAVGADGDDEQLRLTPARTAGDTWSAYARSSGRARAAARLSPHRQGRGLSRPRPQFANEVRPQFCKFAAKRHAISAGNSLAAASTCIFADGSATATASRSSERSASCATRRRRPTAAARSAVTAASKPSMTVFTTAGRVHRTEIEIESTKLRGCIPVAASEADVPLFALAMPPPWVLMSLAFGFAGHLQDIKEIGGLAVSIIVPGRGEAPAARSARSWWR